MKIPFLALIAILFIGGGIYMYAQRNQANQPAAESPAAQPISTDTSPILEPVRYSTDYNYMPGSELVFLLSSNPKDRIVIPPTIATKIMDNGQFLTGQFVVVNPVNARQVILSTHEDDVDGDSWAGDFSFINRIYSYDITTNELTLLATSEDTSHPIRELMAIGTQSSKVIFYAHTQGVDTCGGLFWTGSADRYTYLDMNNIGAGLRPYIVPANKIQQESSNDAGCPGT